MKQETILIDGFSGIGGFSLGIKDAGIKTDHHYFLEIEKHAIANYKYNFKNATHGGSITTFSGTELRKKHPNAKIIFTFGSPCQDFSMAGQRKGLEGERSNLIMEAIRVISEIQPNFFIKEHSAATMVKTFGQYSTPLPTLGHIDLNGNCLIQSGYYPKIESGYTLSDILQHPEEVTDQYFLSQKMTQYLQSREEQTKVNFKPNIVQQSPKK